MSPASPPPKAFADPPRSGVVALLDRASITVADLALGAEGVTVRRWVLAFNGANGLHYTDDNPQSVVPVLARVLSDNGFPRRLACVGLSDSIFSAALAEVPKTSAEALSALIIKRVREQAVDPPGDLLADHAVIDLPAGAPVGPRKGYLAWTDKARMEGFFREFTVCKLEVERVIPPAVALLDVFGRTRPAGEARIEIFLRYCYPSLVIGVCGGNDPLYLRFLPDVMADAQEGVVTTLQKEVLRTAAFVSENHQGRGVERLCFSGLTAGDGQNLSARLIAKAGIPAEPLLVPIVGPSQEADPERLVVLAGLLVHGAPMRGRRVQPMDLLPHPPRRFTRSLVTMMALVAAALMAGVISFSLGQHTVKAQGADVAALEHDFAALSADAAQRSAARDSAADLQTNAATLGVLMAVSGNPVQPLLEALLLVPPQARVTAASLDNPFVAGAARPRLDLRLGGDFSSDAGAARLRDGIAALRARPWCAELSVVQGVVKAATGKPGLAEIVGVGAWLR